MEMLQGLLDVQRPRHTIKVPPWLLMWVFPHILLIELGTLVVLVQI